MRTKSHNTGSKFSRNFFQQLCTEWIVVVQLYCGFFCGVRWRHNRAPNLEPRFLVNFVPVWGRTTSPNNYASIWTLFTLFVRGRDVLCNALNILQFRR